MQQLLWAKTTDNRWLNLQKLDAGRVRANGVYVIWHGGQQPKIIRIGEGDIGRSLLSHQKNIQITRYAQAGPVMVTWAELSDPVMRAGVLVYLTQQYSPLVKSPLPPVLPLAARTPFS